MPENFNINFDNEEDLPPYEEEARQFLLNPANFDFGDEEEEFEDELINDEGMVLVDEYVNELHFGEHPVLPGQDPRGPPYMMLSLYDGAGPQQQQQFLVQDRPGIFEYVAGLVAQGVRMREYVPAPPVVYEFVLQQMEVKEEEDWVCSICLDSVEENDAKTCLHPAGCHTFHDACLQRWLGRTPTCPTCRAAVTPMLMREKH
jgi:Ring finger domain